MDEADILARFARAREFEVKTANGWKFTLRLPSEFLVRRFAMETSSARPGGASQQWLRDMLLAAVVGWQGLTLDDVLHEGDKTALPFSPSLVATVLDDNVEVFDELGIALHAQISARKEKQEASAKNSASASSGN